MKRASKVAFAFLTMACAVVGLWLLVQPGGSDGEFGAHAVRLTTFERVHSRSAVRRKENPGADVAAETRDDLVARVRVHDESGTPVGDVRVTAWPAVETPGRRDRGPPYGTGRTDESGKVEVDLPLDVGSHLVLWQFAHPDWARAEVVTASRDFQATLARGGTLEGRVYDAWTGGGVPDAAIDLRSSPGGVRVLATHSTADGGYALGPLARGAYTLDIRSSSFIDMSVGPFFLEPLSRRREDVPLERGISITGVVLDADEGLPVTDGTVVVGLGPSEKRAALDRTGRFTCAGFTVPPSLFRVYAHGYNSRAATATTGPHYDRNGKQTQDAILRVARARTLAGRVTDASGRGVSGALVAVGDRLMLDRLQQSSYSQLWVPDDLFVRETRTGEDGSYRLTYTRATRIVVAHPSYAPVYADLPPDRVVHDVTLVAGAGLALRTLREGGMPDSGAEVRLFLVDPRDESVLGGGFDITGVSRGAAVTDAEGVAVLDRLSAGHWKVVVRSADGERWCAVPFEVPDPAVDLGLEVTLSAAPRVSGRLLDERRVPIPDATVVLQQEWGLNRLTTTDYEGNFEFRCAAPILTVEGSARKSLYRVLPIGSPTIWVDAGGPVEVAPGTMVEVVASTFRIVPVTLRVSDAETGDRVPFGRWEQRYSPPSRQDLVSTRRGVIAGGVATAVMYDVPGSELRVVAPGYEPWVAPLDVSSSAEIEVQLKAAARSARLRVSVPEGMDIAEVRVYDAGTSAEVARVRHPQGPEFVIEAKHDGQVLIAVSSAQGYLAGPVACRLETGTDVTVTLPLVEGGGSVKVRGGRSESIRLVGVDGLERDMTLDDSGQAWSGMLAPGRYDVIFASGEVRPVWVVAGKKSEVAGSSSR